MIGVSCTPHASIGIGQGVWTGIGSIGGRETAEMCRLLPDMNVSVGGLLKIACTAAKN